LFFYTRFKDRLGIGRLLIESIYQDLGLCIFIGEFWNIYDA